MRASNQHTKQDVGGLEPPNVRIQETEESNIYYIIDWTLEPLYR
jgi:hypothetical protein